jgi:hypothetical protein
MLILCHQDQLLWNLMRCSACLTFALVPNPVNNGTLKLNPIEQNLTNKRHQLVLQTKAFLDLDQYNCNFQLNESVG